MKVITLYLIMFGNIVFFFPVCVDAPFIYSWPFFTCLSFIKKRVSIQNEEKTLVWSANITFKKLHLPVSRIKGSNFVLYIILRYQVLKRR